jgi:hypothetical protein
MTLGISAKCHDAECHYAECHYAECHYAECHFTKCHDAERHDVKNRDKRTSLLCQSIMTKKKVLQLWLLEWPKKGEGISFSAFYKFLFEIKKCKTWNFF